MPLSAVGFAFPHCCEYILLRMTSSGGLGSGASPLREDLITTAVKFLSNPNIQRSPLDQKQSFLRAKGLTEDEIHKAFEKGAALLTIPTVASSELLMYRHSKTSWLRDLFLSVALFGGVTYGLYWIYKKWLETFLFGDRPRRKTTEERFNDLKRSIEGLIHELKQEIITVRSEVDRLNNIQGCNSVTRGQIDSLKADIASVKGILLNRNQFPSLSIRAEPPSIPAWQLQSSAHHQVEGDTSPPQSDHEKEGKEQDDDLLRGRGERSESGGSNSSEGEVVTKNSDSSLEIM
ncbi:peroxisomal biogenesis factor 14 isoform X2 [Arctopsyche grandis]|uniref:peroxisomal biogenesis factor 14 isoform X2 n=1 Tax=Arctopsyche grandis TaxID=121162 RepID=UPI00406D661B